MNRQHKPAAETAPTNRHVARAYLIAMTGFALSAILEIAARFLGPGAQNADDLANQAAAVLPILSCSLAVYLQAMAASRD